MKFGDMTSGLLLLLRSNMQSGDRLFGLIDRRVLC